MTATPRPRTASRRRFMRCRSNCSRTASRARWCSTTMILSFPARWENSTSGTRSLVSDGFAVIPGRREASNPESRDSPVQLRTRGLVLTHHPGMTQDGLLRGACHRARVRATRWLAMTAASISHTLQVPSLPLLGPVIGDAPDDGGIAEFPAQIVDGAFGVGRATVEHVG